MPSRTSSSVRRFSAVVKYVNASSTSLSLITSGGENEMAVESGNARTPLRRLGEPEDIAGAAVYLASKAGRWTTGQTIIVDGGAVISG